MCVLGSNLRKRTTPFHVTMYASTTAGCRRLCVCWSEDIDACARVEIGVTMLRVKTMHWLRNHDMRVRGHLRRQNHREQILFLSQFNDTFSPNRKEIISKGHCQQQSQKERGGGNTHKDTSKRFENEGYLAGKYLTDQLEQGECLGTNLEARYLGTFLGT